MELVGMARQSLKLTTGKPLSKRESCFHRVDVRATHPVQALQYSTCGMKNDMHDL